MEDRSCFPHNSYLNKFSWRWSFFSCLWQLLCLIVLLTLYFSVNPETNLLAQRIPRHLPELPCAMGDSKEGESRFSLFNAVTRVSRVGIPKQKQATGLPVVVDFYARKCALLSLLLIQYKVFHHIDLPVYKHKSFP